MLHRGRTVLSCRYTVQYKCKRPACAVCRTPSGVCGWPCCRCFACIRQTPRNRLRSAVPQPTRSVAARSVTTRSPPPHPPPLPPPVLLYLLCPLCMVHPVVAAAVVDWLAAPPTDKTEGPAEVRPRRSSPLGLCSCCACCSSLAPAGPCSAALPLRFRRQ